MNPRHQNLNATSATVLTPDALAGFVTDAATPVTAPAVQAIPLRKPTKDRFIRTLDQNEAYQLFNVLTLESPNESFLVAKDAIEALDDS